jgi:hypothetical protein
MTPHQLRDRGEIMFRLVCETFEIKDVGEGAKSRGQIDFPTALREFATKTKRPVASTALDKRMKWVGETLGLDEVEQSVLAVMARVGMHDEWGELVAAMPGKGRGPSAGKLALLAGQTPSRIELCLAPGSRLSNTGMIDNDGDGEYSAGNFLLRIARSPATQTQLSRQLMPPAPASTLRWEDFEHLGPLRDIAKRLVAGGEGSSILLYGPPGTGKTEFARLLAKLSGAKAVFAGESDEDGREPCRNERLAHLILLHALTRHDEERMVVVDEADDVLELGGGESRGLRSKVWLNRLVEGGERPTVWIVNEPRNLGEAILRRMDLALEFPRPPRPIRERMVKQHACKQHLALNADAIARLAALPAAPALIGSAIRSAKRVGGGAEEAQAIGIGLVAAIAGCQSALKRDPL